MRIYRVEDGDGWGMYSGNMSMGDLSPSGDQSSPRHPTPNNDSAIAEDYVNFCRGCAKERFGFATLAQLRAWIYKDAWLRTLDGWGYRLSIYEAPRAIVGNTQALFDLGSATLTSRRSLLTLIRLRR